MTIPLRTFYHRPSQTTKQADERPVILTNRNRPAYVLMRFDEYERLTAAAPSAADALAWSGAEGEFDPPRLSGGVRPVDFG